MKILVPGGSGNVGKVIVRHLCAAGHDVRVLSRSGATTWDPKDPDSVVRHLDWADAVINLAGRSVNCRYTSQNLAEMRSSRVDSVETIGKAMLDCAYPPSVWLQASTATIYTHRTDAPNDDVTGLIDPQIGPPKWRASIEIALAWEKALFEPTLPLTRRVAMRSAMTMSPTHDSVFGVMARLARRGLLGTAGSGEQFVSWIHELDFCRAIDRLLSDETLGGSINLCSPNPVPNKIFNAVLRNEVGAPFGLQCSEWMLEVGANAMQTETELILKSRRVVPTRLLEAGFEFVFPDWEDAARDLAMRLAH